ncbi:hypothetical protein Emag_005480 [Eimeria magna]
MHLETSLRGLEDGSLCAAAMCTGGGPGMMEAANRGAAEAGRGARSKVINFDFLVETGMMDSSDRDSMFFTDDVNEAFDYLREIFVSGICLGGLTHVHFEGNLKAFGRCDFLLTISSCGQSTAAAATAATAATAAEAAATAADKGLCNRKQCSGGYPLKIVLGEGPQATSQEQNEVQQQLLLSLLQKLDWGALVQTAAELGMDLPPEVSASDRTDDNFLRAMQAAVLDFHILEGKLVCPTCKREYAISKGIPNMLLQDDEV